MNLYLKFLFLVISRILKRKPLNVLDTCISRFRVGFLDLDLNLHMNNGRFLTVMDLGRLELLMRTGHFYRLFSAGYYPVVFSESIVFKSSLNWLNTYELHTNIDSWDDKFFYMTQKFTFKGRLVASANVRACFKKRGRKGIVKPAELFEFFGEDHGDLPLTDLAKKQIALDEALVPRPKG